MFSILILHDVYNKKCQTRRNMSKCGRQQILFIVIGRQFHGNYTGSRKHFDTVRLLLSVTHSPYCSSP